jgi:hypothetical protein
MDARVVMVFRTAVALATLATALSWFPHVSLLFSGKGVVPLSAVPLYSHHAQSALSLFFLNDHPAFVMAGYVLLCLACVALIIGYIPRIASLLVFVLFASFTARNPMIAYGGTDILQVTLFYTMFLDTDVGILGAMNPLKKAVPVWPLRLVQLQFMIVYGTAGLSKLAEPAWVEGTKMYSVLMDPTFSYFNAHGIQHYPVLIKLLSWSGWVPELAFPVLIWHRYTRRLALIMIVGLHAGILLLMNVHLFSEIMLACLTVFLQSEDIDLITKIIRRKPKSL